MTSVEKITELLKDRNITPTKMMKDLGFSSGLFTQWKQGKQNPSFSKLQSIADYLHVPLFAVTDSDRDYNETELLNDTLIEEENNFQKQLSKVTNETENAVHDSALQYTIDMLKNMSHEDVLKAKKIIEALSGQ